MRKQLSDCTHWWSTCLSPCRSLRDPCPGQLCTPSRLPGPCLAVGRQSLTRPAWPSARRPVGTCRTVWPPHQLAAPLTR
uniref:Sterol regulatory element binding transcription factor 1 n=1 Tax=Rousettus aegyptiacus TaxID=9407 RepID=A0A7J8GGL3_ROUAE|nr:sterol regulatory element binding transcription factor 1 [Rousettus aegyptiacus]